VGTSRRQSGGHRRGSRVACAATCCTQARSTAPTPPPPAASWRTRLQGRADRHQGQNAMSTLFKLCKVTGVLLALALHCCIQRRLACARSDFSCAVGLATGVEITSPAQPSGVPQAVTLCFPGLSRANVPKHERLQCDTRRDRLGVIRCQVNFRSKVAKLAPGRPRKAANGSARGSAPAKGRRGAARC